MLNIKINKTVTSSVGDGRDNTLYVVKGPLGDRLALLRKCGVLNLHSCGAKGVFFYLDGEGFDYVASLLGDKDYVITKFYGEVTLSNKQ